MDHALVSIVVPVYQAESTIRQCVDSILAQTYGRFEALLVDDGSTDGSRQILMTYANSDRRIRVLTKPNGGAASARNMAFGQVTGRYLAFLDSDDRWDPRMLARMVDVAEQTEADIAQCRARWVYENGWSYVPRAAFPDGSVFDRNQFAHTIYRRMIFGIQLNHTCHALYRVELVRGLRMAEDMRTAEDLMYNILAFSKAERYAYVADALYDYNQKSDGLTGSSVSIGEKLRCNRRASHLIIQCLPEWGMDTRLWRACARMRPASLMASKAYRMVRGLLARIQPDGPFGNSCHREGAKRDEFKKDVLQE